MLAAGLSSRNRQPVLKNGVGPPSGQPRKFAQRINFSSDGFASAPSSIAFE